MSENLDAISRGLRERYGLTVTPRGPETIEVELGGRSYLVREKYDPDVVEDCVVVTRGGDYEEWFYFGLVAQAAVADIMDGIKFDEANADLAEEAAMEASVKAADAAVRSFLAARVRKALEARPFDTDLSESLGPVLDYLEPPQA